MGEVLSQTVRARQARWSAVVLAFLSCLVIAGCAQHEHSDEQNRSGGFYGGISGGR
jgi:hypothetical protein